MKRILLILLVAPLIWACDDEAEQLTTITQSVTLKETVPVVASGSQVLTSYSGTFQAGQYSEYSKFGDKIDDIVVNSITITILDNANYSNSNPDQATIVDTSITFEFTGGSLTASLTDQNIADALGVAIPADFSATQLENLATQLLASDQISYEVTAEVSEPVSFDMEVAIDVEVSGSVIN